MTTDIKELVKQLRVARVDSVALRDEAADALEALAGEVERVKWSMEKYEDRAESAEAERDRLKAALVKIKSHEPAFIDEEGTEYRGQRASYRIARKALGGAS